MKDSLNNFLEKIAFVSIVDLKRYRHVIDCIYHYLPEHKPGDPSFRSELHEIDMLIHDILDTLNGEYDPYYDDEE